MGKHILIVSQYFYPESFRINDICFELVKRGYRVTVITGIPNYPKGKFNEGYGYCKRRKETIKGVKVIRLAIIPRKNNKFFLILNYFSFVISGWLWKTFTKLNPDIVFNFEVSPMTQALPAVWFSKKKRIPFILYVQDLWPENVEIVGNVTNKRILKSIERMVMNIYQNSTRILVTSKSFQKSIIDRGIIPTKVEYWPQYAEEYYRPIEFGNNSVEFTIAYTGNIGVAQGLEVLPKVASMLKGNNLGKKIKFLIVGDGRNKDNLIHSIKENTVEEMFLFLGHKNPNEIPVILSNADVAFLSFADNKLFRMTVPAKLQTYLACGKPILGVASGETKLIINESKSGLCSEPNDLNSLYENILEFSRMDQKELKVMSENAIEYVKHNFDKEKLMDQLENIIAMEVQNV